uniref:Uncharacterized protein n=1 Tax=Periophthalmus magnuspinnatus TaxID=409849 RepID=A0A3B3ZJ44_9GOBI
MPENEEIKSLLSGSYIHYFHCMRIVEILRKTEASSKNIFGRYSSQRMKVNCYNIDTISRMNLLRPKKVFSFC